MMTECTCILTSVDLQAKHDHCCFCFFPLSIFLLCEMDRLCSSILQQKVDFLPKCQKWSFYSLYLIFQLEKNLALNF